jgi:hypothetical protein
LEGNYTSAISIFLYIYILWISMVEVADNLSSPNSQSRYVVLGTGAHLQTQTDLLEKSTSKKGKNGKSTSKKPSLIEIGKTSYPQESLYISIYKAKVCIQPRGLVGWRGIHILTSPKGRLGIYCATPIICVQILRNSIAIPPKAKPSTPYPDVRIQAGFNHRKAT